MQYDFPISRDNHFVPQALLRRWSRDGESLACYRLLVSSPNVPLWERRAVRGAAWRRDLYTAMEAGREDDRFERWADAAFERPGLEAVERLVNGQRLSAMDWRSMVRLLALQDVRTPLSFQEFRKRWDEQLPSMLTKVLEDALAKQEDAIRKGEKVDHAPNAQNDIGKLIRVEFEHPPEIAGQEKPVAVRAIIHTGRRLWLESMRALLAGSALEVLCSHRWSVATPFGDDEWPITDHPVLRVNESRDGDYNFGGGWGSSGTQIMMPVSPRRLLYVQVGTKHPNRFEFSREQTERVRRFLVERAQRWIYASRPAPWVEALRPRFIDAAAFTEEERAWRCWHDDQSHAETS